ncbi:MAG: TolB family protein [Acidimicrobiales bacterium]
MHRRLFPRRAPLVAVLAIVVLAGCAHRLRETNTSTSGQTPSISSAGEQLSMPAGGWPGSPVSGVRTLVSKYAGRVSWSPEGQIAYGLFDHMIGGTRYADIYVMNADGTGAHCLTCNNPHVPHLSNDVPVWDPSGRFIVFEGQNPGLGPISPHLSQGGAGFNNNLWAITPDGSHAWQLTNVLRGEAVLHPQFSPDGHELVWAAYDRLQGIRRLFHRGQWDVHTARFALNATGQPYLTDEHVYRPGNALVTTFYETHVVSNSGTIIFSSNMDSKFQSSCNGCALGIWRWNPNRSSPPVLLTPDTSAWNEHAALSPSGRHIAWITSQGERFVPNRHWGATLQTDWWLMRPNGTHALRATYFNSSNNPGLRVICAESSWNATGTALVGTVDLIHAGAATSEIVVITFRTPQ